MKVSDIWQNRESYPLTVQSQRRVKFRFYTFYRSSLDRWASWNAKTSKRVNVSPTRSLAGEKNQINNFIMMIIVSFLSLNTMFKRDKILKSENRLLNKTSKNILNQ